MNNPPPSRLLTLQSAIPLLPFGATLFAIVDSVSRPTSAPPQISSAPPTESDLHEASERPQHDDYFSSGHERNVVSRHGKGSSLVAPVAAHMHLNAACPVCDSQVQVAVPQWMMDAMNSSRRGSVEAEEFQGGVPGKGRQFWRTQLVEGSVEFARAVKASPIPGIILAVMKAIFAFLLYLDTRFSLHQKMAILLSAFLEGLIEIEREVGIFRGAGEAISVLWEASVKSTIALAKSDGAPPPPVVVPPPQPRSYFHRSTPSYPIPHPMMSPPFQATTTLPPEPMPFEPAESSSPTLSRRTLRHAHSSPTLPLLLSTSSSSHLLSTSAHPVSTSVPLSRVSSAGSNSSGCLSPPLNHGGRHHARHGSQHHRRRSRSAHEGEREADTRTPEVVVPGANTPGWAGRMVGVVGRRVFDR